MDNIVGPMALWIPLDVAWFAGMQYLKTVVPYEPSSGAPSVERLQIYIKSQSYSCPTIGCVFFTPD